MIKLSELIVKPYITPERAKKYYRDNIWDNNSIFGVGQEGWNEFMEICKSYYIKYNFDYYHIHYIHEFEKLSQSELNKLYQDMRTLVRKYVGKEILSELQVKKPRIKIGYEYEDEKGVFRYKLDEDLVLKHLLPRFPHSKQNILDMVEDWNDYGVEKEEIYLTLDELIKVFKDAYL